jgi:hypothetical protein
MSFQWMQMRISEETERRDREAQVLARLPHAVDELETSLAMCIDAFGAAFGSGSARVTRDGLHLNVTGDGGTVEVAPVLELPGIEIKRNGSSRPVQVGMLPGDRVFYLDLTADQYLSMEELTRLILDRVLFPKLKE